MQWNIRSWIFEAQTHCLPEKGAWIINIKTWYTSNYYKWIYRNVSGSAPYHFDLKAISCSGLGNINYLLYWRHHESPNSISTHRSFGVALRWRHNGCDSVSNHQPRECLLRRAHQRKHQSSSSLAFVRGIHRRSVNSPHKWPVTQKMFPFDDVIMGFGFGFGGLNLQIPYIHHKCTFCSLPFVFMICCLFWLHFIT